MSLQEQIIVNAKYNNATEFKKICSTEKTIPLWDIREEKNETLLHLTIFFNANDVFDYLILFLQKHLGPEELRDYVNIANSQKVFAIQLASFRGNVKVIKTLISLGANINCVNRTGLNVIHFACQGNQPNSLAFFREYHNMNFEATDYGQGTPLHWACYSGSDKAAFFLLFNEVDMNKRDKHGYTALHLAVLSRKPKIIKKLIQYGINYKIKDNKQMTARELAIDRNLNDISAFLTKAEKWNPCSFTSIVKKTRWRRINIWIVIFTELLASICIIIVLFPCLWYYFKTRYHLYIYLLISFLFFSIYVYLIFSNPGLLIVKSNKKTIRKLLDKEVDLKGYCLKCLVESTDNSKHCILCEKCIDGFDHHCFWINNCIGKSNQKIFLFFLLLSVLNALMMLILTIISIIYSTDLGDEELEGYYLVLKDIKWIYKKWTQIITGIFLLSMVLFYLIELIILIRFNFKSFLTATRISTRNIGPLVSSFIKSTEVTTTEDQMI